MFVEEEQAASPMFNKSKDSKWDGFKTDLKRKSTVVSIEQEEDISYLRRTLLISSPGLLQHTQSVAENQL